MAWDQEEFDKTILGQIWSPIRKYLIPDIAGGGHTKEEEEKIIEDYEKIKDKTWWDTFNDILGFDSDKGLFVVAIVVFIFLAVKD